MPQIAQQDYLRIAIEDKNNPTESEKAEIRKHVQNGTIWDVLINYDGAMGRIVGVYEAVSEISFFSPADGEIFTVEFSE